MTVPLLSTPALVQGLREAAGSGTGPADLLNQAADELERLYERSIPKRVYPPPFQYRDDDMPVCSR